MGDAGVPRTGYRDKRRARDAQPAPSAPIAMDRWTAVLIAIACPTASLAVPISPLFLVATALVVAADEFSLAHAFIGRAMREAEPGDLSEQVYRICFALLGLGIAGIPWIVPVLGTDRSLNLSPPSPATPSTTGAALLAASLAGMVAMHRLGNIAIDAHGMRAAVWTLRGAVVVLALDGAHLMVEPNGSPALSWPGVVAGVTAAGMTSGRLIVGVLGLYRSLRRSGAT